MTASVPDRRGAAGLTAAGLDSHHGARPAGRA